MSLRARDAALEWLPQETIVFDEARTSLSLDIDLDARARFIGWDVLCLGRPAGGHPFASGWIDQRMRVHRAGRPVWLERLYLTPDSPLRGGAWGLRGCTTLATLVCTPGLPEWVDRVREAVTLHPGEHFGVSAPRELIVCRFLGHHAYRARAVLTSAWNVLRPLVVGTEAVPPRIWAT